MNKLISFLSFWFAVVAVGCSAPLPAFAAPFRGPAGERVTVAMLLEEAKSTPWSKGFVVGFIAGVFDNGAGQVHCAPLGVSEQLVITLAQIALESASEELKNGPADRVIATALNEKFPCAGDPQPSPKVDQDPRKLGDGA